jgi:hypothetical protein
MAVSLIPRPAVKPGRTVHIAGGPAYAVVTITDRRAGAQLYRLKPIARAAFGRAWKMTKRVWSAEAFALIDGEHYDVNLGGGYRNGDVCDCKGFTAHGHCKHQEGLRALEAAGHRLPTEQQVEDDHEQRQRGLADLAALEDLWARRQAGGAPSPRKWEESTDASHSSSYPKHPRVCAAPGRP